jgi:GH24 family phage-related lysozyme (muramidase)
MVFANGTAADAVLCQPPTLPAPGDACAYPGVSQQRASSTYIISPDGSATITVRWNAECPLNGANPSFHYWYVDVVLTHTDGTTQDSGPLFAETGSTSDVGAEGFGVGILPAGARTDTIQWQVSVHCAGPAETIGSGSITLCAGETKTSQAEKDAIKKKERYRPYEYDKDGAVHGPGPLEGQGNCTIGWGYKIHDGDCDCAPDDDSCENSLERPYYKGITEKTAQELFDKRIKESSFFLSRVKLPLNQCQVDALTDFFYNIGRQGFYNKRRKGGLTLLGQDLEDGDYSSVPAQILTWDEHDSNRDRRVADAAQFSGPCDGC